MHFLDLMPKVRRGMKAVDLIPAEVRGMGVAEFLTRERLMGVGASPALALKIHRASQAVTGGLDGYENLEGLIASRQGLCRIPNIGEKSLEYIVAAINATVTEKESD